jgi:hypothetical protein
LLFDPILVRNLFLLDPDPILVTCALVKDGACAVDLSFSALFEPILMIRILVEDGARAVELVSGGDSLSPVPLYL